MFQNVDFIESCIASVQSTSEISLKIFQITSLFNDDNGKQKTKIGQKPIKEYSQCCTKQLKRQYCVVLLSVCPCLDWDPHVSCLLNQEGPNNLFWIVYRMKNQISFMWPSTIIDKSTKSNKQIAQLYNNLDNTALFHWLGWGVLHRIQLFISQSKKQTCSFFSICEILIIGWLPDCKCKIVLQPAPLGSESVQ